MQEKAESRSCSMAAEGAGQSDLRIRKWGKSGCGEILGL